mgnify:CR=1 FL=1
MALIDRLRDFENTGTFWGKKYQQDRGDAKERFRKSYPPRIEEWLGLKNQESSGQFLQEQLENLKGMNNANTNLEASGQTPDMESLAQLKAYSEKMALQNALEVKARKELEASGQTPDYGSMPASWLGDLIGALGGNQWKQDVRSFDNAPIWDRYGWDHPRNHLPDWILDQNIHPSNNPLNRGDVTPIQQLKDALMRQFGQQPKN